MKDKNKGKNEDKGAIILYQPDNSIQLEMRLENETIWLNRQQLSKLFDRDIKTIGKHINNALKEELSSFSTVVNFATVQLEFDAYVFVSDLIKYAKKSIVLIDNYVDESVLLLLSKRKRGVDATIYTVSISLQFQFDVQKHNASLKDLGKKLFAFSKMVLNAKTLLQNVS
jgi:hypothetical protein